MLTTVKNETLYTLTAMRNLPLFLDGSNNGVLTV